MLTVIAAAFAAALSPEDASSLRTSVIATPLLRSRACGLWQVNPVRRDAPSAGPQTLGDMPPANLELTVLRLDSDGCSVPVVVRRNVSGDGRFATRGR